MENLRLSNFHKNWIIALYCCCRFLHIDVLCTLIMDITFFFFLLVTKFWDWDSCVLKYRTQCYTSPTLSIYINPINLNGKYCSSKSFIHIFFFFRKYETIYISWNKRTLLPAKNKNKTTMSTNIYISSNFLMWFAGIKSEKNIITSVWYIMMIFAISLLLERKIVFMKVFDDCYILLVVYAIYMVVVNKSIH